LTAGVGSLLWLSGRSVVVLGSRLLLLLSNAARQNLLTLKGSAQLPLQLENLLLLGGNLSSGRLWGCFVQFDTGYRSCLLESALSTGTVSRVRVNYQCLSASACWISASFFRDAVGLAVHLSHCLSSSSSRSRCARSPISSASDSSTTLSTSNSGRSVSPGGHLSISLVAHLVVDAALSSAASLPVLLDQIVE